MAGAYQEHRIQAKGRIGRPPPSTRIEHARAGEDGRASSGGTHTNHVDSELHTPDYESRRFRGSAAALRDQRNRRIASSQPPGSRANGFALFRPREKPMTPVPQSPQNNGNAAQSMVSASASSTTAANADADAQDSSCG